MTGTKALRQRLSNFGQGVLYGGLQARLGVVGPAAQTAWPTVEGADVSAVR